MKPGQKKLTCWISVEAFAAIEGQARALGRTIASEVQHALDRHLSAPPVLAAPPLPPAVAPPPTRRRGKKTGPKPKP